MEVLEEHSERQDMGRPELEMTTNARGRQEAGDVGSGAQCRVAVQPERPPSGPAVDPHLCPREAPFLAEERDDVTILFGGLTWKHERLIEALLAGAGYRSQALPETDRAAHELGKEFCASGLCNPDYFTTGNLIRFLHQLEARRTQPGRHPKAICIFHRGLRRPMPLWHVRKRPNSLPAIPT